MFYIIVFGAWGSCIISKSGKSTWDLKKAKLFKSYSGACQYIKDTWKFNGVDESYFHVYKKGGKL